MDKKYIILMIVAIVIIAAAVSVYTTHTSERKNTLALDDKQIANITVNINGEKTYTTNKNGQVNINTKL